MIYYSIRHITHHPHLPPTTHYNYITSYYCYFYDALLTTRHSLHHYLPPTAHAPIVYHSLLTAHDATTKYTPRKG